MQTVTPGADTDGNTRVVVAVRALAVEGVEHRWVGKHAKAHDEAVVHAKHKCAPRVDGIEDALGGCLLTADEPEVLCAFDRECPNCYDDSRVPIRSYALQVASNGIATCKACQRQYDLNNGGIIASGDAGQKLIRYRASTTGAYGVLSVN